MVCACYHVVAVYYQSTHTRKPSRGSDAEADEKSAQDGGASNPGDGPPLVTSANLVSPVKQEDADDGKVHHSPAGIPQEVIIRDQRQTQAGGTTERAAVPPREGGRQAGPAAAGWGPVDPSHFSVADEKELLPLWTDIREKLRSASGEHEGPFYLHLMEYLGAQSKRLCGCLARADVIRVRTLMGEFESKVRELRGLEKDYEIMFYEGLIKGTIKRAERELPLEAGAGGEPR